MKETQLTLGQEQQQEEEPSPVRIRALAGVIGGMRWPGRDSFAGLTKEQQREATAAARDALLHVGAVE